MHGLNEELGRHRGRGGKTECSLCGDECENVMSCVMGVFSIINPRRACAARVTVVVLCVCVCVSVCPLHFGHYE